MPDLPLSLVVINADDGCGGLLCAAAQAGCDAIVNTLLEAGASPFEANKMIDTALHRAAAGGKASVSKRLLECRADPQVTISSHLISSRLVTSHLVWSHPISSHLVSSRLICPPRR